MLLTPIPLERRQCARKRSILYTVGTHTPALLKILFEHTKNILTPEIRSQITPTPTEGGQNA